jgi:asparagine synthase (glutamine-hydrolysing)
MIGVFGLFRGESGAPANLSAMQERHPSGYSVHAPAGEGAAIGRAVHKADACRGISSDSGSGLVVSTVGEVYNAGEILGEAKAGNDPAPLICALYRKGALERLAEVNGQFCAALYDQRAHRLILITDRHALYPIHVWRQNREIVFASMIHVLLADQRVPRKANGEALAQLFTMQRTIGRVTSIAGVEALPAACIWECGRDGVSERSYWTLNWRQAGWTKQECATALDHAFRNAVKRQTTGQRLGLLLSGGIDSRWILGAAPKGTLSCWTTASFAENPELKVAQTVARICGAEHHAAVVDPEETLAAHDEAVVQNNGLYPASPQFGSFMPHVGAACDTVLSGHGLDYTLRGYYLPSRFFDFAGSHTRLPVLRPIGGRPTGADVLYNLRQGPPATTLRRIVSQSWRDRWWRIQEDAMEEVLAPWLASDEPYNAWDAFILHAVSKHYAFTGMMSVRAFANLRMPAYDKEVMDVYLKMPPNWRCSGRVVLRALEHVSPPLARLPNSNTGFPANREPWVDVATLIGRGILRNVGLMRRPETPSDAHSAGSWQNVAALYRGGCLHRARFIEIRERLDGISFGILDCDGLRTVIDEHLDGRSEHTKLMRQLLTHDAWVRRFGIEGHA